MTILAEPVQVITNAQLVQPGDIQVKLSGSSTLTRLIVAPVETWDRWDSIHIQVHAEMQIFWSTYITDKVQPVYLRFSK